MRNVIRIGLIGLLFCSLTACGLNNLVNPPEDQRQESLDIFVQAMRLGEFKVASTYLVREHREPFLDQFKALDKDLSIVDVRIEDVTILEPGDRVDVQLELDYYLLPSATVKTFSFDHTWVLFEPGGNQGPGFLIETPFPSFP